MGCQYDGPVSGSDTAQAVDVSPDGSRVVVTGTGPGMGTSNDYSTVAYKPHGRGTLGCAVRRSGQRRRTSLRQCS